MYIKPIRKEREKNYNIILSFFPLRSINTQERRVREEMERYKEREREGKSKPNQIMPANCNNKTKTKKPQTQRTQKS